MLVTKSKSKRGYVKGDPWLVCDQTSQRFRRSDTVEQWDGLIVWKEIHEPRHPQEFVRGVRDDFAVRDPRPQAAYEVVISTGNDTNLTQVQERDLDNVFERDGDEVLARTGDIEAPDFEILNVDLGSEKYVSRAKLTVASLSAGTDNLNIYTSSDGSTYDPLESPGSDIIQNLTLGEETVVGIGRYVRYVSLRLAPLTPELVSTSGDVTQFDLLGKV